MTQKVSSGLMEVKSIILLLAFFLTIGHLAEAQQKTNLPTIGWLTSRPVSRLGDESETLMRELHALGYVEGQNIAFEYRYAKGDLGEIRALADELVGLKVDVLLTSSRVILARAAKYATSTTPVVFVILVDPVVAGLVASLAKPGGNVTGFTTLSYVTASKRLELLKETVPKLSRVGVLWNFEDPQFEWRGSQVPARTLGLRLHSMEVYSAEMYESAFEQAVAAGVGALVVAANYLNGANQKRIMELATTHRLPAMYSEKQFVASGGLMSFGSDRAERWTRVASMLDKILKGRRPAEIPVEQPTKFEFVINLKTAKQIGLSIPPNVLARADRVIR